MSGLIYDEISEFLKPLRSDSDSVDAIKRLMYETGKQFGKTSEAMKQSLHDWWPAVDFNKQFIISPAELERQRRRETFFKYRAACLHGERQFYITFSTEAKEQMGIR